ncbi:LexA/Signal peptidase, partial [Lophium mytilinum]
VFYLFTDNYLSTTAVKGESMTPTLSPKSKSAGIHDRVLLSRSFPRQNLKRGDIVTFWKPHNPEEISIKRIIALEGDTGPDGSVKIVVPHNHIWVEGDNWTASRDSNDFGPISKAMVDGKAL